MNLVIIKYFLLIGAVLVSTAFVAGPLNPENLPGDPDRGDLSADSIYRFGSEVFYKEIDKPGNEYMKGSVEGYSQSLVPTDEMEEKFLERWGRGVALFHSGYQGCIESFFELASVPEMTDRTKKSAVCKKIRASREEMLTSLGYFTAAKAMATPGSSRGFTIGMAIPRIEQITDEAEGAEIACMKAVIADNNSDSDEFSQNLKEAGSHFREMRRIFPELGVISDDFRTT
ncbi:MAG: hypothetical protein M0Q92_02115 [Methanoregula sp.]|jgi:hypothetical protein|nr:hypothetical protein [Methanoregula sp.]